MATLFNGNVLPSFIAFDATTLIFTIQVIFSTYFLAKNLPVKTADRLAPMKNRQAPVKFLIPLICNFISERDFFPLFYCDEDIITGKTRKK